MNSPIEMQTNLGIHQKLVTDALEEMKEQDIVKRIWNHDYTVWKPTPQEISNRLGWLTVTNEMEKAVEDIHHFVDKAHQDGYKSILLLGMGGSSLAPELFSKTFKNVEHKLFDLVVLDSTDPDAILSIENQMDITKTLFIVASKSGGTVETLSLFKYFYNKVLKFRDKEQAGKQFIGITDPGSKLINLANRFNFRKVFLNNPNIGGRYSVLSFFGLVPAAFVGVDLKKLLKSANLLSTLCKSENPLENNPAALLGAMMGELSKIGKDKLTLITDSHLASFGDWVEQLIAESTGKEGKGILPVVNEPLGNPEVYGNDRFFVFLTLNDQEFQDEIDSLSDHGHPIVKIISKRITNLGGLFFLWEFATAISGYRIGINPFDQPNVESAKVLARQMVSEFQEKGELPHLDSLKPSAVRLKSFLSQAKPGDYVAIQAYINPTEQARKSLNKVRLSIRDQYKLATTLGYGPRFLHSTGQLHKGGKGNGLFIQITSTPLQDLPIPDEAGNAHSSISFGTLKMAQALGDSQALIDGNRRLVRFHTSNDHLFELERLIEK